jgi:hypothetical protein
MEPAFSCLPLVQLPADGFVRRSAIRRPDSEGPRGPPFGLCSYKSQGNIQVAKFWSNPAYIAENIILRI